MPGTRCRERVQADCFSFADDAVASATFSCPGVTRLLSIITFIIPEKEPWKARLTKSFNAQPRNSSRGIVARYTKARPTRTLVALPFRFMMLRIVCTVV
jgi:hypothetical protein